MSLKNYKDKMGKSCIKELNIKGKMCPMTFVYTKLALEEMEKGEIIEVTVDFPPAIENVPDSCRRQGIADVLGIEKINKKDNIWKIILKKL